MAIFVDAQTDAADLASLVNDNGLFTTRYGDNPKKSWLYMQDEFDTLLTGFENEGDSAIELMNIDVAEVENAKISSLSSIDGYVSTVDGAASVALASIQEDQNTINAAAANIDATIASIDSKYKLTAIGTNGAWESGVDFETYNEYMVFNGTAYQPKPTTSLPYTTGATPNFDDVQPIKQNGADSVFIDGGGTVQDFIEENSEEGIFEWQSSVSYPENGITKGSDGSIYQSVQQNTNANPTTDNGTNWLNYIHKNGLAQMSNSEGRNIEVLACVIRQDGTIPTVWNFIEDGDHLKSMPSGASIDVAPVGETSLRINFGKTYSRVISSSVVVDEDLAEKGIVVGASVDNADAILYFSKNKMLKANVWHDGSNWQFANETTGNGSMSPEVSSVSSGSGNQFIINHKEINGSNVSINPLVRSASETIVPYSVVYSGGNGTTQTRIKFIRDDRLNFVGAPDTKMVAQLQWFDGNAKTNTFKDKFYEGNVWCVFVLEV